MFRKLEIYLKFFHQFFKGKANFLIKINDSNFFVRPRSYDIEVLGEVYFEKVYNPTLNIDDNFKTIVDLGAYIGDFSIWAFKKYDPDKLLLVEPSIDNALLLMENIKFNGAWDKTTIVQKAIYSEPRELDMDIKKFNQGMNRINPIVKDVGKKVKAITFKELMEQNNVDFIDYLKIDIEGAEKYILTEENTYFLKNKVKYINMETHTHLGNSPRKNVKFLNSIGYKTKYKKIWNNFADMIEAVNTNL